MHRVCGPPSDDEHARARLEPRGGILKWIPLWGQVRVIRKIQENWSTSSTCYLATLHWLIRTEDVLLEELSAPTELFTTPYLRRVRRVRHPNVQAAVGTCLLDGTTFSVTPRIVNGPLILFLRGNTSLDRRTFVPAIVDGMRYLHQLGIVHGNVDLRNVMIAGNKPIIVGFSCNALDHQRLQLDSFSSWFAVEDEPLIDVEDTDAPYEFILQYPRLVPASILPIDDHLVGDGVAAEVDAILKSDNVSEDIFALGFLIMEIFSELHPRYSRRALQILRMGLKKLRPPHPDHAALLRGLDNRYWSVCLSCWKLTDSEFNVQELLRRLSAPKDPNWIQPPFDWPLETVEEHVRSRVTNANKRVRDKHDVKDGRDAEAGLYEVMGTWEDESGKAVPVKIISPTLCRRGSLRRGHDFMAEVFVWSQLHHDNILPLLGIVDYENTDCFLTPWMDGGSCTDFMRTRPDLDPLYILVQIADVLRYLHTREPPIIHGYIRARSVLVSGDGKPYIGNFDFQPLQYPDRDFDESIIDDSGRWSGPELATSKETTKSDVFAFAMLAYELYSRELPYAHIPDHPEGDEPGVWSTKKRRIRPERPNNPMLTDKIWALMQRCWAHVPAERPSMSTVSRELVTIQDSRSPGVDSAS